MKAGKWNFKKILRRKDSVRSEKKNGGTDVFAVKNGKDFPSTPDEEEQGRRWVEFESLLNKRMSRSRKKTNLTELTGKPALDNSVDTDSNSSVSQGDSTLERQPEASAERCGNGADFLEYEGSRSIAVQSDEHSKQSTLIDEDSLDQISGSSESILGVFEDDDDDVDDESSVGLDQFVQHMTCNALIPDCAGTSGSQESPKVATDKEPSFFDQIFASVVGAQ